MKGFYTGFILATLIFVQAQASLAQQSGEIKAYSSRKLILRQSNPVIIQYDLPVFMSEEFYPDYVQFGVSIKTFGEDYGHFTSDPQWTAFTDQIYESQGFDEKKQQEQWKQFQQYAGPLQTNFTQVRPGVGTKGSFQAPYKLPRYLPPLGRSYTINVFGEGEVVKDRLFLTHDAIKRTTSIGHVLLFGPEPKATIKTKLINVPGALFHVTISNADTLVDQFGEVCVVSLYHAGRVHLGGATEGDWLLDRRVLMKGQTEYSLDPNSSIRSALPYDKPYDSFIGVHLIELWCRGVLVDQKEVLVDLPNSAKLVVNIAKKPGQPPELTPRLLPSEPITSFPETNSPGLTINIPLGEEDEGEGLGISDEDGFESSGTDFFIPPTRLPPIAITPTAPQPQTPDMSAPNDLADYLETMLKKKAFTGDKKALKKQIKALRALAKNGAFPPLPPPAYSTSPYAGGFGDALDLGDPVLSSSPGNDIAEPLGNPGSFNEAGLNKPPSLYKVSVAVTGLTRDLWKYLVENTYLYAIPAGADLSSGKTPKDYIVHWYQQNKAAAAAGKTLSPAEFWLPSGQYDLQLGWDGDKGVRRRVSLAQKIITVTADDEDVARGRARGFNNKTPINNHFNYGDLDVTASDKVKPFYPGTARNFILTSKADFSNYDLHYQIKQKNGFLLGCLPYEWLADEDGKSHETGSFHKLYLGRDHPRFGEGNLTVASLLDRSGATQKVSINLPYFSGDYVLSIYASRPDAGFYLSTPDIQKLDSYTFTIKHPVARISFPKGDHFTIKGSFGLDVNVNMPEGVSKDYKMLVLGMDGFLKEKIHLDPNRNGRKGYRADYFYISEGQFSTERTDRLLKASFADVYYANHAAGTARKPVSKNFRSGETFTIAPVYSKRSTAFNDLIVIDKFGNALMRKRAYWNPWGSADYLERFYFAPVYPKVLLPQEPSDADWIQPDDRLRKRAVWAPDSRECKVPILAAKLNIALGAPDKATP